MEIKISSLKQLEGTPQSKEYSDLDIKPPNKEVNIEKKYHMKLGSYEEAPKYLQDNEYIKSGYLIYCNTFNKIFKSFLILHNETINIWSHLLGAIFFLCLIFYTSIFITNIKTQIFNIRIDSSLVANKAKGLKGESNIIMDNIYKTMKEIENNFKILDKEIIYSKFFNKINYLNDEIKNNTLPSSSSFSSEISSVKESIIDLIKLLPSLSQEKEIYLDKYYNLNLNNRKKKKLVRWPLYIIILGAILCLSFSATFHLLGLMNEKYYNILSRFDYGGISLLISGSCYPPYYYFFYYSKFFRNFYIVYITSFGIGTFLYSLTDDFNKPTRRSFRGILYLVFGLCTSLPVFHMTFFGSTIEGYSKDINLFYWYLGGISYVIGTFLYILRFPEKKFPKTFDYFGASHQIFHVLVFFGALFHFMGSLDAYNYRFRNLKVN